MLLFLASWSNRYIVSPYGVFPPTIGPAQRLVCAFEGTYADADGEPAEAAEEIDFNFATPGFGDAPAAGERDAASGAAAREASEQQREVSALSPPVPYFRRIVLTI